MPSDARTYRAHELGGQHRLPRRPTPPPHIGRRAAGAALGLPPRPAGRHRPLVQPARGHRWRPGLRRRAAAPARGRPGRTTGHDRGRHAVRRGGAPAARSRLGTGQPRVAAAHLGGRSGRDRNPRLGRAQRRPRDSGARTADGGARRRARDAGPGPRRRHVRRRRRRAGCAGSRHPPDARRGPHLRRPPARLRRPAVRRADRRVRRGRLRGVQRERVHGLAGAGARPGLAQATRR